jgi:DhnA family fructose-bisphosphate aldolase class Ia
VESFRQVVAGCPVPVVIAGGPKMNSDRDILEMVQGAIEAGGAGVSIGRNVFQHRDPSRMVGAISMIVHENSGVDRRFRASEPMPFLRQAVHFPHEQILGLPGRL